TVWLAVCVAVAFFAEITQVPYGIAIALPPLTDGVVYVSEHPVLCAIVIVRPTIGVVAFFCTTMVGAATGTVTDGVEVLTARRSVLTEDGLVSVQAPTFTV